MGNDLNQYRAAIGVHAAVHAAQKNRAAWTPFDISLFWAFVSAKRPRSPVDDPDLPDDEYFEACWANYIFKEELENGLYWGGGYGGTSSGFGAHI